MADAEFFDQSAPYGFWDWSSYSSAADLMNAAINNLKTNFNNTFNYSYVNSKGKRTTIGASLPIVLTETGWKSFGTNTGVIYNPYLVLPSIDSYAATPANQKWYLDLLNQWLATKGQKPVNIFLFEAFDESWKSYDNGWGLWNSIRAPKYALCGTKVGLPCKKNVYSGAGYYPILQNTNPNVSVDPSQLWLGFTQVITYGFGTSLPPSFLPASFQTITNFLPGIGAVELGPNTFWYAVFGGPTGNIDSLYYVQNDNLLGNTVVFKGLTLKNPLPSTYAVTAFIKVLDANYGYPPLGIVSVPLVSEQPFELRLNTAIPAGAHVQYGFELLGPDVDPITAASLGNVLILSQP